MFSRFSAALQNAVDALAPPVPLQEDFKYHWKMIMNFYVKKGSNTKTPIESTNIPAHLDQLLKILVEEEESLQAGSTGPSIEYLLEHRLPDLLVTLALTDCPPGMRRYILNFFSRLIVQIKQPLVPHVSVYVPIQRLVGLCRELKASPSESEEIHFLCTLCAVIRNDSYLINFFNEQPCDRRQSTCSTSSTSSESEEIQLLLPKLDFEPIMTNPEGFPLVDALLTYLESADSRITVKACEGIMVLASLPDDKIARSVVTNSHFCTTLAIRLVTLFCAIPKDLDPNDFEDIQINWGLDSPQWADGSKFPGCRQVSSFLAWLDYCDQLVREAHPIIGEILAQAVKIHFLQGVLEPALLQDESSNKVLVTAYMSKCLKQVTAPYLLTEFCSWLVGENRDAELCGVVTFPVKQQLLDNCLHEQDELSLETLRLFEVLLEKPGEHVLYTLVLTYLIGRGYYDSLASDSLIASWSDEEDEREKRRDGSELDISPGSSPVSRTLAPSNINKIINCFLFLLPEQVHSTDDSEEGGYEQYLQDAHKQYLECVVKCCAYNWPQEALFPETPSDTSSSDSRPEADHTRHFYEGAFLRMLFTRLEQLPDQPYEINLQLTSLVSRLALLPHPYLHEFLLNPLLPVFSGTRTLFSSLEIAVGRMMLGIRQMPNYHGQLCETRHRLLGDGAENPTLEESNTLLESFIVLEEFCKELAAITFVKYHHSS